MATAVDWFSSLSATSHSTLAATLAGFAITVLAIVLVPFANTRPASPKDAAAEGREVQESNLTSRWFVIRFLVMAFMLLTVSAVEWGVLAGFSRVEEWAPNSCQSTSAIPGCAGMRITTVGYGAATILLTAGALSLLAAICELILLTISQNHQHAAGAGDVDPSSLRQPRRFSQRRRLGTLPQQCPTYVAARFVMNGYAVLFALASWQVAIGAGVLLVNFTENPTNSWLTIALPIGIALISLISFFLISWWRFYNVHPDCVTLPEMERSGEKKQQQRFVTIGLAITGVLAVTAFTATPLAPLCERMTVPEVDATTSTVGVAQCAAWTVFDSGPQLRADELFVILGCLAVIGLMLFAGLLIGSTLPRPSYAPDGQPIALPRAENAVGPPGEEGGEPAALPRALRVGGPAPTGPLGPVALPKKTGPTDVQS